MNSKYILITFLILGMLSMFLAVQTKNMQENGESEIEKDKCLKFDEDPILISRVPIDNKDEVLREYYYNASWIKKCNN